MSYEFWQEVIKQLSEHPTLQGWVAAIGTLIVENVVCVIMSGLVASGDMLPRVAFWAATFGVFAGDIIIYAPSRFAMRYIDKLKWVENNRKYIRIFEDFFSRHVGKTMFIIRFTPGIRTVALIAAGMLRVPLHSYILYSLLSSVVQATLVVFAGKYVLERPVAWLKQLWRTHPATAISLIAGVFLLFLALNWIATRLISRHIDRKYASDPHPLPKDDTPCSGYEFWHSAFFIIPLSLYGLWQALRTRSLRAPLCVNPALYASGAVKESKSAEYALFPQSIREKWFAQTAILPAMPHATFEERAEEADRLRAAAGITYPFVAKPDLTYAGAGVRRIRNESELLAYCRAYPREQPLLIQELLTDPVEASLVYLRRPGERAGKIISLALRETPCMIGDGFHTLRQLILNNNRARRIAALFFKKNLPALDTVIPAGERIPISFTGNHGQGAISKDIRTRVTPALAQTVDAILGGVSGLCWIRLDLRCPTEEDLLAGANLRIMEINGSGRSGQPLHIWDPATPISTVYGTLMDMVRTLFAVGAQNRAQGCAAIGWIRFMKDWCATRRLARAYPDAE